MAAQLAASQEGLSSVRKLSKTADLRVMKLMCFIHFKDLALKARLDIPKLMKLVLPSTFVNEP
jgi:hypothetical protein